jgi:hypothetical protein
VVLVLHVPLQSVVPATQPQVEDCPFVPGEFMVMFPFAVLLSQLLAFFTFTV